MAANTVSMCRRSVDNPTARVVVRAGGLEFEEVAQPAGEVRGCEASVKPSTA